MARKTVAAVVGETLAAAGVKRIYGVAGDSLALAEAANQEEDFSAGEKMAERLPALGPSANRS